jgi:hypothetical protein
VVVVVQLLLLLLEKRVSPLKKKCNCVQEPGGVTTAGKSRKEEGEDGVIVNVAVISIVPASQGRSRRRSFLEARDYKIT